MNKLITVITAIRNREAWRIRTMVESIRSTGANPSFHIIDYGSSKEYADEYESLCKELKIKYTHMYSEGLPWNKPRAMNFGARFANTPYIVTSDVDMIYDGNAFQWCLDNHKKKSIYHIETFWLPENGDKTKSKFAGTGNCGGFCFSSKEAFEEIGGYDERYIYWGIEDLDWPNRLKSIGYKQVWLPSEYKIYHQWHKPSETSNLRPASASYNSVSYLYQNTFTPKIINYHWGKKLEKKDRPILKKIESDNPALFTLSDYGIDSVIAANDIKTFLNKNKFIKIDLHDRNIKRPLSNIKKTVKKILHPFAALAGLRLVDAVNFNFDFIYEVILLLEKSIIKDYYISPDCRFIYLLSCPK